jgi:hypothetical protein
VELVLVHDAQVLHAICVPTLEQLVQKRHLLLGASDDEASRRLKAKVKLAVKLWEHLVARPAILGTVGARLVVEARVDDPATRGLRRCNERTTEAMESAAKEQQGSR